MPKNFNTEKIAKLKNIDRFLKAVYLSPKNAKTYPPIVKKDVLEIFVIGFFLIGDTIIYLPALKTLKRNFPNARITIVCEKPCEIILKNQGLIDEFVIVKCPWLAPVDWSKKNIFRFFSSIKTINRKNYDLAIDFRGDWRNIFFMNFVKATRKVGYNASGGDYMLTDSFAPKDNIDHFIEESFHLLEQIGCYFYDDDKLPVLKMTDADKEFADNFKINHNLQDKFIIGVHPGTTQEVKRWDETKYAELIIRLSFNYSNSAFVLYEGPGERETVSKIENLLKANGIIDYVVVKRSLHDYIVLISICSLMICNDSGAAHIAAAYGIPNLVIFGNVDPKFVIPYGAKLSRVISHELECKPCNQSFCKFGTNACIVGVTEEDVYNPAINIINQIKAGSFEV